MSTTEEPEDVYFLTCKPLTEHFQYYLQTLSRKIGSKINGIIVCDHRNPAQDEDDQINGYGLIKIPVEDWKENDAESSDVLEPAIMTQSQRTSYDSLDSNY